MKLNFSDILFALPAATIALIAVGSEAFAKTDYFPGEVIVKYRKSAQTPSAIEHSLDQITGMSLGAVGGDESLVHVKLLSSQSGDQSVESTLFQLAQDPNVEYAQPNYIYHAANTTPNDPNFSQQWSFENTGQVISAATSGGSDQPDGTDNPGTSGDDMSLPAAWDYITDCSSVVVAVLDTGIDYNHDDLAANMWNGSSYGLSNHGINFQGSNNNPMDDNGHGTHVAGVIGAVGNNSVGNVGICWKVQLMAIKVLDLNGVGSTVTIANGMNWAPAHGAKVLNMSLGSTTEDPTLDQAAVNVMNAGAVIVAAAGNNGEDNDQTPFYPCNSPSANIICVAAIDQSFNLASFSNYGAKSVQVGAPGVNILSTWPYLATTTVDNFSGWSYTTTTSGGWGDSYTTAYGPSEPMLSDPSNYGSGAVYNANTNDHAYKIFNLSGATNKLTLQYYEGYNLGSDTVSAYVSASGGDPVTSGVLQEQDSGNTGSTAFLKTYNLLSFCPSESTTCSCDTVTCSIGFQLSSGSSPYEGSSPSGAFVIRFETIQSVYSANTYDVLEGTSMATPHVAGLAAMLFAFQPAYTWSDVVASIEQGGLTTADLVGKTITGNVVNAFNSLGFIRSPQGVTAQKL